ncbi:hypothetical protein ABZ208_27595 [Streptomyces sp. NPDC006208]|uniref:hypothetical protein n=1 Tax=Streptomyces sp. NPDC006208 TaxID=3156734 RepID=UPI0033A578FE
MVGQSGHRHGHSARRAGRWFRFGTTARAAAEGGPHSLHGRPATDSFADLKKYAKGTFQPNPTTTEQKVVFHNDLQIPIQVVLINRDGSLSGKSYKVTPGGKTEEHSGKVNDAWLVRAANSGALIDVLTVTASQPGDVNPRRDPRINYVPNMSVLSDGPPSASATNKYPTEADAHNFLVGQGENPHDSKGAVTREVWWNLSGQSYSLAPDESLSWTIATISGVERSSTVETQFITKLGLEAKGGWEAITTTINASFEKSYRQSESITLKESVSSTETRSIVNTSSFNKIYRVWQIMETYTIWKGDEIVAELSNDTGNIATPFACYDSGGNWVECGSTH